jgi:hypothetical protein
VPTHLVPHHTNSFHKFPNPAGLFSEHTCLKINLLKNKFDFLSGILVKWKQSRPLLTFDIPQTALVATLDT